MTSEPAAYALPDLAYGYDALEPVISARIMELHHGTHHATYVKTANEVLEKLEGVAPGDDPSALVRSLSFNVSGHVLHSLFWNSMSPDGGGTPPESLESAIGASFGSMEVLQGRMTETIEKLSGSGWAALSWEPLGSRLLVSQIHDHQNDQLAGATPLLVIDGWEHAYYLQYEAAKAKWAKAFWDVVDWKGVAARFEIARSASLVAGGVFTPN
jgi:Fe-Mn family superoxide dismutase